MTKQDLFRLFKIEDLYELPKAIMAILVGPVEARNEVYLELLELNNHDVSYDWFQSIYESEMSERKDKQQDFTPREAGVLLSKIVSPYHKNGSMSEVCTGNGGLLIAHWWQRCLRSPYPCLHYPSENVLFDVWELSNRSIPILLLNLSIRGMMGVVYHGDVLEQTVKAKYILLNRNDDTLAFSEIIHDKDQNLKIFQEDGISSN